VIVALGIIGAALLGLLAGVHLYWGCGGRWWTENIVPESEAGVPLFNPGPLGFFGVSVLLAMAAWILLARVGLVRIPLSDQLVSIGAWTIGVLFLLRAVGDLRYAGIFRSIVGTRFAQWDAVIYTPICLLLGVLVLSLCVFFRR
jgi:hypothetical protein